MQAETETLRTRTHRDSKAHGVYMGGGNTLGAVTGRKSQVKSPRKPENVQKTLLVDPLAVSGFELPASIWASAMV